MSYDAISPFFNNHYALSSPAPKLFQHIILYNQILNTDPTQNPLHVNMNSITLSRIYQREYFYIFNQLLFLVTIVSAQRGNAISNPPCRLPQTGLFDAESELQ